MKLFKLILSLIVFATSVILCHQIISNTIFNQQNKLDYAEINHVKYGLFSVNKWKEQLSVIMAAEINNLSLTHTNELKLKEHVETQLDALIDNVAKKVKESNDGSAKGWVKQSFINSFVSIKDIKSGIPEYADAIIIQMTKRQTELRLKGIVKKRIEQYFDKTFEAQDLSRLNRILTRTLTSDIEGARAKLNSEISSNQRLINTQTLLLIVLSILIFALPAFSKQTLAPSQYIFLILTLLLLLIAGVTTPMIDMEAKLSQMSFVLMDHVVHFEDQVLYFQSKSVLDVFWIMFIHQDIQMKIVGILMVTFSIAFPVVKMISSLGYYYNYRRAREHWLIRFFVLKSGKWSMTDVMIVAIFMAYIGFNGIITSQFGSLNSEDQEMVVLMTNGTSLMQGFYLFLTYTVLALFLSGFLTREVPGLKSPA